MKNYYLTLLLALFSLNSFAQPNAGGDGTHTVVTNEIFSLPNHLVGTFDTGGLWLDPTLSLISDPMNVSMSIPGQFIYTYIVSEAGYANDTSRVIVDVYPGIPDDEEEEEEEENNVGLLNVENVQLSCYPNPAKEVLNLSSTIGLVNLDARIYDLEGKEVLKIVKHELSENEEFALNVMNLQQGVYILRVNTDQGSITKRVEIL